MSRRIFYSGDPVPWFTARSTNNPDFLFDTAAGRYLVMSFFGSAAIAKNAAILLHTTTKLRHLFDDDNIAFFGVSIDPLDETEGRVRQMEPGIRYFWDFDGRLSALYGAADPDEPPRNGEAPYRSFTLVIDPSLHVIANISMADPDTHNQTLASVLTGLPPVRSFDRHAPVLILPGLFEPNFCRQLIELYERHGGGESGFMRERDGNTVGVFDNDFKRRKDFRFDDTPEHQQMRDAIRARVNRRLVPEIRKTFQFTATRIERYIVSCYEGQTGGFFRAHRDNTTKATMHRIFACTVNLNAEEYEGGDLRFPEYGMRTYRAPAGGVVMFSCSLLHEALPVTRGVRYAFLPFLYNEAAAKLREENLKFLSGEIVDHNAGNLG